MVAELIDDLRLPARLYVLGVIAAGAVALVTGGAPRIASPAIFTAMLGAGVAAGIWKAALPLPPARSGMTVSMSYVVFLAALLLLDRADALLLAVAGAWVQCEYRPQVRYPVYRTVFSVASIVLALWASGQVLDAWTVAPSAGFGALAVPAVTAGVAFFLVNSVLVGLAVSLATAAPFVALWWRGMAFTAPAYLLGAVAAAGVATLLGT